MTYTSLRFSPLSDTSSLRLTTQDATENFASTPARTKRARSSPASFDILTGVQQNPAMMGTPMDTTMCTTTNITTGTLSTQSYTIHMGSHNLTPTPADTQNTSSAPANFDILRGTKADYPTTNRTSSVTNHAPINPESNMHIHPQGRTPPGHTKSTPPTPVDTQNTPAPAHLDILTGVQQNPAMMGTPMDTTMCTPTNITTGTLSTPSHTIHMGSHNLTPTPADTQNTPSAPAHLDILTGVQQNPAMMGTPMDTTMCTTTNITTGTLSTPSHTSTNTGDMSSLTHRASTTTIQPTTTGIHSQSHTAISKPLPNDWQANMSATIL